MHRRFTYGRSSGKPFFLDAAEARALVESRQADLTAAEDAYARDHLYPEPTNRRGLVSAIAADVEIYQRDGSTGDAAQDIALEKVLDAHEALEIAKLEAKQGRLFPKGVAAARQGMFSAAELSRAEAALAQSKARFEASRVEREREARYQAAVREGARQTFHDARKAGVILFAPFGRYAWQGEVKTDAEWISALEDAALGAQIRAEIAAKRMADAAAYDEARKRRLAEDKKAKSAAARQKLPPGYIVEKGRGGYFFQGPGGVLVRGFKTKGEAVIAAVQDANRRR